MRESLTDEVSVTVGHAGAAHADVQQEVLLMPNADAKMQWLQARMPRLVDEGQVLVFVNSRAVVDGVVTLLQVRFHLAPLWLLHLKTRDYSMTFIVVGNTFFSETLALMNQRSVQSHLLHNHSPND